MDQEVADRPPTGDGIAGRLLKAIGQPPKAFTLSELEASGPLSRSAIYREIRDGRLIARKAGDQRSCWRKIGTPTSVPCRG